VTREMLMVALQNVQHMFIRATEAADTTIAMLHGPDAAEWLRALGLPWLTVRHDLSLAGNAVAQAA
ncbi:hypothetical protein, partial [Algiphilus sp.]|uniref:hypothetical protein n=1 Tax=Algiphilus sp. TaxID=1872431 RepID=UPI003C51B837